VALTQNHLVAFSVHSFEGLQIKILLT
jgi:hypothetical protein